MYEYVDIWYFIVTSYVMNKHFHWTFIMWKLKLFSILCFQNVFWGRIPSCNTEKGFEIMCLLSSAGKTNVWVGNHSYTRKIRNLKILGSQFHHIIWKIKTNIQRSNKWNWPKKFFWLNFSFQFFNRLRFIDTFW